MTSGQPASAGAIPVSPAELASWREGALPPTAAVAEGIWSVALTIPAGSPAYSFCYVIRGQDGDTHLVDPGWDSDGNRRLLLSALAALGTALAEVASITLTHHHRDHAGMAGWIRNLSAAPILMHRQESGVTSARDVAADFAEWGVPIAEEHALVDAARSVVDRIPVDADGMLEEGERLPVTGRDIRVLHVPGHTPGHVALLESAAGIVLTGDALLPVLNPGIWSGRWADRNPLVDYLGSLDRLAELDGCTALPGHEFRFRGMAARCRELAEHQRRRRDEVAAMLAAGDAPATVWETAMRIAWSGAGLHALPPLVQLSALAQTALFVESAGGEGVRRD